MIEENFSLRHRESLEVKCTLRVPQGECQLRLVIVAHGFRGFKDWGFFPFLCQHLCQSRFAVLSFNHALSGVTENPYQITDHESFSRNSTTQELKDWDLILDTVLAGELPHSNRIRLNAIGIVGHSRGGSYGILMASRTPQVQSVVAWGAISTFQRYSPETQHHWRREGYLEVGGQNSARTLRLAVTALDALERNYDRLDVLKAMRALSIPVLLLHGREDKAVPLEEGRKLWQCANAHLCRFHVIEAAGHALRTQHPFIQPSPPLMEALFQTVAWLQRTLPLIE